MSDPLTFQDLYSTGQAELRLRNPAITDFSEGSIADVLVASSAAQGEEVVHKVVSDKADLFFDTATGADLDTLAYDRLRLQRPQANAAVVPVQFSRPTTSGGAGTIPAGTVIATPPDPTGIVVQFTTLSDIAVGTSALVATGTAQCVVTGTSGNVKQSSTYPISVIKSALFDASLTVSQTADAAGGADEASDDDFRALIHAWPDAQRRGTEAALEYGAKTVAGVAVATAVEQFVNGIQNGITDLYVSDINGGSNSMMIAAVQSALLDYRAQGNPVNVWGCSAALIVVSMVGTWDKATQNTDQNRAAIRTAVANRINNWKKAGATTIYLDRLKRAAMDVGEPLGLDSVAISLAVSPGTPVAADLVLASLQVPQTNMGLVTMT